LQGLSNVPIADMTGIEKIFPRYSKLSGSNRYMELFQTECGDAAIPKITA
jgi:hypothetical protein